MLLRKEPLYISNDCTTPVQCAFQRPAGRCEATYSCPPLFEKNESLVRARGLKSFDGPWCVRAETRAERRRGSALLYLELISRRQAQRRKGVKSKGPSPARPLRPVPSQSYRPQPSRSQRRRPQVRSLRQRRARRRPQVLSGYSRKSGVQRHTVPARYGGRWGLGAYRVSPGRPGEMLPRIFEQRCRPMDTDDAATPLGDEEGNSWDLGPFQAATRGPSMTEGTSEDQHGITRPRGASPLEQESNRLDGGASPAITHQHQRRRCGPGPSSTGPVYRTSPPLDNDGQVFLWLPQDCPWFRHHAPRPPSSAVCSGDTLLSMLRTQSPGLAARPLARSPARPLARSPASSRSARGYAGF